MPLIPQPVQATRTQGVFELRRSTSIIISSPELQPIAALLQRELLIPTGFKLNVTAQSVIRRHAPSITLSLFSPGDSLLGAEGYRLEVTPHELRMRANALAGLFYAMQTLSQLMPAEIESRDHIARASWPITCATIVDYPRFAWRGLMLDVSRHFFDKEFIKRYLDQMAKYKFNVFHWHLTDAPGWRIEIKGLPRLTEIGAWRASRIEGREWIDRAYPTPDSINGPRDGGYYTQDDIREIVNYARERFITIVPEIDIPGHSHALIAAYPELSCPGLLHAHPEEEKNVLCAGNEDVFAKLDKIIGEVAALFPGEYLHIGGDEVFKDNWKQCPLCQARIRAVKLKDETELQNYFTRRVEKIVNAHGKRLIGWEEILDGGLSPGAAIMSWRGPERGIEAAKQGHLVVMTPARSCYLDLGQGDDVLEPPFWGNMTTLVLLRTAYQFDPVLEGVDPKYILGGQGNLWTELIAHPRHAEYMTWPRALALSEVFWSPRERQPWDDFIDRMEGQLQRFDMRGVNYSRSAYQPLAELEVTKNERRISLRAEISGIDLYYTFDGSNPDQNYQRYSEPLTIPAGAEQLRVASYRHGQRIGEQLNITITQLEKRREVKLKQEERDRLKKKAAS